MRRVAAVLLALVSLAPIAAAAFPQSAPNDPSYAPAENDSSCKVSVTSEQHYLYSFMPRCAPLASDPENAAGMSVDAAWKQFTIGEPSVVIAYVEGGINWHDPNSRDLANQVWINAGELPLPQGCAAYDCNGDGRFDVRDYASDARVTDCNANGFADPEDLICAFSDGTDADGNGFVDDISGWDFYDHQNDPATVDRTYEHSNNQMRQAAAQADNGIAGAGVCPGCMVLPIKAGAEALDRTDDLAQAWLYADRVGAKVVVSVTADLGYSDYMRQTVEKLWADGVVMVEASNDFDSLDHQGGMWWPHVLPGNGLVSNNEGTPDPLTGNAGLTSFRARSGLTSWGTHSVFNVATDGGSTSESTPTTGGVIALLLSEGVKAFHEGKIAAPLTGPQAIQVAIASSSDINGATTNWPSLPGWDAQFGYGRPNVLRGMQMIDAGQIPPTPSFDGPAWYTVVDPTTQASIPVDFTASAPWVLEWGLGRDPTSWTSAGLGAAGAGHAELATSLIPASVWSAPFQLSSDKTLATADQYTVTLRLRATDASGLTGEDRRAIAVHHDDALLPGFPLKLGGESSPALADLQGLGRDAIIFGDANGLVHAIDATTGAELSGWPATTPATVPDVATAGIAPGHEPIIAPVSVGDLRHDGQLEVVVPTTTGSLVVFDAQGHTLWTQTLDRSAIAPAIPRPALDFTRLPHKGTTACAVLVDLDGDGALEIVQAAWDGNLYAFHADGSDVAGWPVHVALPAGWTPAPGHIVIQDAKLDTTPAVADLDGDGKPEIVVRSQQSESLGAGIQPLGVSHAFAFHADGSLVAGWPASFPDVVIYYGSAQEFITEGSDAPVVADVDGDGKDEVAVSGVFSPTFLLTGAGQIRAVYGPVPNALGEALAGSVPLDAATGNLVVDAPVTFTTTGAFGRLGGTLSFAQPGSGGASIVASLLTPGSGTTIQNQERAYDALTGAARPGFPAKMQGLDFLGAPIVTDMDGLGLGAVVDGADSSAMHAWNAAGAPVAGWPKFTSGWTLFSPAAGDVLGDGHVTIVATTREGYLYAWRTDGLAANNHEWPTYHHDNARTGRYQNAILPNVAPMSAHVDSHVGGASWQSMALVAPMSVVGVVMWRRRG